jgi:hypothetical protein
MKLCSEWDEENRTVCDRPLGHTGEHACNVQSLQNSIDADEETAYWDEVISARFARERKMKRGAE